MAEAAEVDQLLLTVHRVTADQAAEAPAAVEIKMVLAVQRIQAEAAEVQEVQPGQNLAVPEDQV
jgi:hypothetical protein